MTGRLISTLIAMIIGAVAYDRYEDHLYAEYAADRQDAILEGRARLAEMSKPHAERLQVEHGLGCPQFETPDTWAHLNRDPSTSTLALCAIAP